MHTVRNTPRYAKSHQTHAVSHDGDQVEEDSLDGTERCVILDPPSSSEADVAGEEVVHIKEQLVSTELWENLGELASQLPDALAAEEGRKR